MFCNIDNRMDASFAPRSGDRSFSGLPFVRWGRAICGRLTGRGCLQILVAVSGFVNSPGVRAEERFLLAADNQVVEVNRAGRATDGIGKQGHTGIYEAWRLPDGGVAYAHKGGLAVFDAQKRLVVSHAARAGSKGGEANSCVVLGGGERFALLDSGVGQIRVVDRSGAVVSETPLPGLEEDPLHSRYRTIRAVPGERAYWVAQYGRKTLLKLEEGTGRVMETRGLDALLKTRSLGPAFGVTVLPDASLWVATSTGRLLVHLGAKGEVVDQWSADQLGLRCRYLLGTQRLSNGNLLVACGDYHLKTVEEGRDLLAELDAAGRVVWRLSRDQLVDQIEGHVELRTGLEEMRITNVHAYDSERIEQVLEAVR
ncbi:MAG: hypothetical protein RLZZ244_1288 [Verrucomicrobiota bacterium]